MKINKKLLIDNILNLLFDKKLIGVTRKQLFSSNRVTRFRAKSKLIDNVFLKDFKEPQLSVLKKFYLFTLLRLKRQQSKIIFGEELLKESLKEESFLVAFEVSQILMLFSNEIEYKQKYSNLSSQLLDKIRIEHLTIANYIDVLNGSEIIEYELVSKRAAFYHYFTKVVYVEIRDSTKIVQACKDGIEYFKGDRLEQHFLLKSFVPLIYSGESDKNILRYIEITKGNNKLNAYAYRAIYWSYKADYHQSIQITQQALKGAKTASIIELLRIIEAWQYVMIIDEFKFSKFLNDITIFAKQKDKENAGLILLKFLYWFKKKDTGKVIDNEISLKRYARRYVSGRMLVMYQFIFLFIKHSFKPPISELERLKSELNTFPPLDINIEIVPFEVIVERFFVP